MLVASTVAIGLLVGLVVAATPERLQPAWTHAVAGDPTVVVLAPAAHEQPDVTAPGRLAAGSGRSAAGGPGPADDLAQQPRQPLVTGVVGDSAAPSMLPASPRPPSSGVTGWSRWAARGCPMILVWQLDDRGHSLNYSQECSCTSRRRSPSSSSVTTPT